jgi:protocatechuate 3,4-dioxygenase beta subunit
MNGYKRYSTLLIKKMNISLYFRQSNLLLLLLIASLFLIYETTSSFSLKVFAQNTNQMTSENNRPVEPSDFQDLSASQKAASTNETCVLTPNSKLQGLPQQTEGPYFVDGMPNRSDIREESSSGLIQEGIKLSLTIHVYGIDNGSCVPIKGAKVDVWHANSTGVYSAVAEMGTSRSDYLRGNQITDDNGSVKFTTNYPGWNPGRAIHIHDKVRALNDLEWTSQIYFDDSLNEKIHRITPYSNHGNPQTPNEPDMIFTGPSTDDLFKSNSGKLLLMNVTKSGEHSYAGSINIVLNSK